MYFYAEIILLSAPHPNFLSLKLVPMWSLIPTKRGCLTYGVKILHRSRCGAFIKIFHPKSQWAQGQNPLQKLSNITLERFRHFQRMDRIQFWSFGHISRAWSCRGIRDKGIDSCQAPGLQLRITLPREGAQEARGSGSRSIPIGTLLSGIHAANQGRHAEGLW